MRFRTWTVCIGLLAATLACVDAVAARPEFKEVPCADLKLPELKDGATCGRVSVPERPGVDGTIMLSLPVVILRASGPAKPDDAVLYLHGGPGLAALEYAPAFDSARSITLFRKTRDVVMFDQRGTGLSTPAVCPDFDAEFDRLVKEAPETAIATKRKRAAAVACRDSLRERGRDPRAYTSAAIADDAEALRKALGYGQWNVLATSYGSFPAFELARRHPATVRSIVLNSPFPPNSPNRAEQFSTTVEGLAALQARCNADPDCRAAYPDMRKDAATAIARLDKAPLKTKDGQIDGYSFLGATWNLLVRGKTAPLLPEFLKRAAAGDNATVRRVGGPFAGPQSFGTLSFAQQWLVSCHDIYPRPSADLVRKAMAAHPELAQDVDPHEQDIVCDQLQPGRADDTFFSDANLDVPTLVYAGEYDPATPTSDATATMQLLRKGTLVSVTGASHAPMGTDDCTLGIAAAFLDDPQGDRDTACVAKRQAPTFPAPGALDEFMKSLP